MNHLNSEKVAKILYYVIEYNLTNTSDVCDITGYCLDDVEPVLHQYTHCDLNNGNTDVISLNADGEAYMWLRKYGDYFF